MEDILNIGTTPIDSHRDYYQNTPIDALSVGDIMSGMSTSFQEIMDEVSCVPMTANKKTFHKVKDIVMKKERIFFTGIWLVFLGLMLMVFT